MPDSPAVVTQKAELRRVLLATRAARTPPERVAAAAAVARVLAPRVAGARVAACVPTTEEPGHGQLPDALAVTAARVLLPVVPATGRELVWAVHDGRLAAGRFGLVEPVGPRLPGTALGTVDVFVVPALAVARDGTRLGRGGGYYDRALLHARAGAVVVAVVFDDELVDTLPAGAHDVRVHAVVTPSGGWQELPPHRRSGPMRG
ncbi:5-formyltetrahydrofolate cyclo-ligase [Modestobacter sp. DSM 44400]|uniref:5-formyltetrahydrofolate cyclo-ligase n=1 Tax=Modestobacter sp. DSM 44400 TaxID=1550230 RepID=UPI000894DA5D|nr:5-formyltetrahydrofolate cyclo-ligase [Modestobacter sp. DSM 44400]SDY59328.1 5-formyltetrahydrofolate cyclo-ligase [Modestobacter sp. DSM 44400]